MEHVKVICEKYDINMHTINGYCRIMGCYVYFICGYLELCFILFVHFSDKHGLSLLEPRVFLYAYQWWITVTIQFDARCLIFDVLWMDVSTTPEMLAILWLLHY